MYAATEAAAATSALATVVAWRIRVLQLQVAHADAGLEV
jgi:hypothetical protein